MEQQQQGRSSSILLVLLGFVLLCTGVLLASQWLGFVTTSSPGSEEPQVTCPSEATQLALLDTARADLALREKNFGDAHTHIQRARVRLEAAVAQMQNSDE